MATGQHAENLAWIRERWPALQSRDALLDALLQRFLAGEGELLRVSPQRTVLQIEVQDRSWLCKLTHPRRRFEALRRLFSEAAVVRERDACLRLQSRLGLPLEARAERITTGFGIFARPYWEGEYAEADAETAHGIAALHALKWSDRDLALDDLRWIEHDGERVLIPLDLGHAEVAAFPVPAERIYRALLRLLAQLDPYQAAAWAPELLAAHRDLLPDWELDALLQRLADTRRAHAWKRSRRALRTCSDFVADGQSARRRGFRDQPPQQSEGQRLAHGPRSTTTRVGSVVWKYYPRPGLLQQWRRKRSKSPGAMAYRKLALLEIVRLPATQPLAWLSAPQGEWVATRWSEDPLAGRADLPRIAEWLARLHSFGFGSRDTKCSNFCMTAEGPLLIDSDGITARDHDRARDLARLLAEEAEDGPQTAAILAAYQAHAGPLDEPFRRRLGERCEFFRAKLRAAKE